MFYKKTIIFFLLFILFPNIGNLTYQKNFCIKEIFSEENHEKSLNNIKKIKIGMTKIQVKKILKDKIIINIFNHDFWNYIVHIKLSNLMIKKRIKFFFKNNILVKINYSDINCL